MMLKGYSYQEGSHVRRRHGETKQDWPAGPGDRSARAAGLLGVRRYGEDDVRVRDRPGRPAGDGELDGVYGQFGLAAAAAGREGKWK